MKKHILLLIPLSLALTAAATDHSSLRDGSWFVATNWSPATIPASGDNVLINHGVAFDSSTADQSVWVNNLGLYGATLQITGPATLSTSGTNSVFLGDNSLAGTLYNQGTVHQGLGTFTIHPYSYFQNQGGAVYDFTADGSMLIHSEYYSYFENRGVLRKSGGAGTSFITNSVNNLDGTIQVDSGTLCLMGAGTSSNGLINVAAGAVLDLTGGSTPTWAGTVGGSGAGAVSLKSGTLNASPSLTLNLSGSLFQWTSGTINGLTTNQGGMTVAGSGAVNLGGSLYNRGLIRHTNTAQLVVNGYSYLRNLADGIYEIQGDGSMFIHSEYYSYFENHGLLRKSSGDGVSAITNSFNNLGGTIQVDSGTLRLVSGGASSDGTFNVAAGAVLDLTGGNSPTWTGIVVGSGSGTVSLNSGTLNASPNLTLNLPGSLFQWTGGTINGLATNLGVMTIAGPVNQGGNFYNKGVMRQASASVFIINGYSHFHNLADGLYDIAGDCGMLIHSEYGGTFENHGLLRKSGGTGVSAITNSFNNQGGSIRVDSGTLQIQTFTQGAGALTLTLGGTNAGQSGQLRVVGAATLAGPLNVVFADGFTPSVGDAFQILSCGSRSGVFSATNMPAGLSLTYSNSGAYLLVASPVPRTLIHPLVNGTNFAFAFQTENGGSYTIEYNNDLATTNWLPLQTVTGDGALRLCAFPMTNGTQRYFRVRQP